MTKWEVVDSYGKVVYTGPTLRDCGVWIDPIFGINFTGHDKVIEWDDTDRVTKNPDGSYTVEMYDGGHGVAGELTVRKAPVKTLDDHAREQETYWRSVGTSSTELAEICGAVPEWDEPTRG